MNFGNIRIVLVNPLYGGNVGSICRAMSNMGLSDLAVAGSSRMDMNEARMMACHAQHILDGRKEYESLAEAVSDCNTVFGTTARVGLYRQHAGTPREAAGKILEMSSGGRVALVFGREDNGLSNDELALCTHIIQIPTTKEYTSINLAQAAMICCYELFVASGVYEGQQEKSEPATSELRERMFAIWRDTLLGIGFMKEDKADHMMFGLRRVLSRGAFTIDDVHIMMGVARQLEWATRNRSRLEKSSGDK